MHYDTEVNSMSCFRRTLWKTLDTSLQFSTVYHPQTDGLGNFLLEIAYLHRIVFCLCQSLLITALQLISCLFLAVKDVLLQLRPLLSEKQLLVSVAAGVKLKDLQEWAGHSRFVRVMPNTPAAVGKAASVISLGAAATEEDGELISKLFGAIGKIWIADEKHFDAITGLSASGPAYIFLAIEALADGGVAAGLPRELALGLASQTVR
ncbi:hypothetical protein RJ639_024076 [Escallonia herrerae]|uniref:Pyrroline-5-carboxylate reductase dimerisation domain-containing protein n=1 Tax=Escallonia herrerae TaxID=1293975 RepID=A0AA89AF17_9ASTE|nr:hypothetical protein RJ639_024076 [Escallonia herrerae]